MTVTQEDLWRIQNALRIEGNARYAQSDAVGTITNDERFQWLEAANFVGGLLKDGKLK